ncbi:oxysterol-binding protein-related protein 6-like isoform X2 [Lycorma delicatula]|uniref:oxysterol-binding protein-related protein 6-like isoform X2 n=1 Tax=Lycorma delicatula TaxID=130591 RepID=UPI003F511D70
MTTSLRHIATEPANLNQKTFSAAVDRKRSPQMKNKSKTAVCNASDSEGSADSNSVSGESNDQVPKIQNTKEVNKRVNRRGSEWEILEGLRDGQRFEKKPEVLTGYLHKKRKWPLKGWHKRYFLVDKGILVYGKSPGDVARGKIHGSVDIGLSVISTKTKRRRLDIDAEEFIYHLKAKQDEVFQQWVEQLKQQRLYRQHVLTYGTRDNNSLLRPHSHHSHAGDENTPVTTGASVLPSGSSVHRKLTMSPPELGLTRENSMKGQCSTPAQLPQLPQVGRLTAWLVDANPPLELAVRELSQTQQNINQLSQLLQQLETSNCATDTESCSFTGGLSTSPASTALSCSNPSLTTVTATSQRPQSLPGHCTDHHQHLLPVASTPDTQLHSDFTILAKDIHSSLKSILYTLTTERDRLKAALDMDVSGVASSGTGGNTASVVVATLRQTLHQTLQQNAELRARLNRIHETSDLSDVSEAKPLQQSLSYSSSCISASEFFDAEEYQGDGDCDADIGGGVGTGGGAVDGGGGPASDTSSEAGSLTSEEGSVSSENSEMGGSEYNPTQNVGTGGTVVSNMTGRRTKLPAPRPNTEGLSLWNLLCKNIGKDLSQVSMPVALNEPLNMLQRLCEDLEYSELLDKASELSDPYERMVYVAAFAVSSYGSSYFRAGSKPFNPLLGETYECIREDKGFRFIAEQVSHHPPVSVCFAESKNFVFCQDARIKTKFWGKSMEFQPTGFVNVKLSRPDSDLMDHYRWNKVTTCVHNLFGGQRWVDQYGELKIQCGRIVCKLTFVKASYWSAKRHEVHGMIMNDDDGKVVRNLFGKWSEALYCGVAPSAKCIWRQGTMPEDYEMYYGFTRFAMELNELDQEMSKYIPSTDTRFRPDQRLLEEGNLNAAETLKLQLEQAQRDRRKKHEQSGTSHEPKWFSKTVQDNEETWEYNHKYWEARKNPGFVNMKFEPLW